MKCVARYGEVTVDPGGTTRSSATKGKSRPISLSQGPVMPLLYGDEIADQAERFHVSASRSEARDLQHLHRSPARSGDGGTDPRRAEIPAPAKLMIASTDNVDLQILGQHGPTTQFKLLIGPTTSARDKLAASRQINDVFEMDFAPGGTNIPHNHRSEEEIYFVLRGTQATWPLAGRWISPRAIPARKAMPSTSHRAQR